MEVQVGYQCIECQQWASVRLPSTAAAPLYCGTACRNQAKRRPPTAQWAHAARQVAACASFDPRTAHRCPFTGKVQHLDAWTAWVVIYARYSHVSELNAYLCPDGCECWHIGNSSKRRKAHKLAMAGIRRAIREHGLPEPAPEWFAYHQREGDHAS